MPRVGGLFTLQYSRCPRPPRACCPGVLPHVRKAGRRRRKGTKLGAATYISAGHMSASFQGRYTRCVPAVVAGRCTRRVLAGSSGRCTRCIPADRRLRAYGALSAVLAGHSASSGKRGARCGLRPDRRRAWWGRPRAAFAADRRAKRLLIFSSRCVCRSVAAVVPIRGPAVALGRQRPSHAARC